MENNLLGFIFYHGKELKWSMQVWIEKKENVK